MSQHQRRQLARVLAELDGPAEEIPDTQANPYLTDPKLRRQRRLALLVAAACCVVLAGWIVVLAATLPRHFDAHYWRAVWVNFDVFLFAAFVVTAWALWRERQVLILLLVAIGTMLCCDAWFDVGTSLATSDLWISLVTAAVAELPLAFLAFAGARRLLRATVEAGLRLAPAAMLETAPAGTRGPTEDGTCSLRRTPLSGHGLDEALPRGRAHRSRVKLGRPVLAAIFYFPNGPWSPLPAMRVLNRDHARARVTLRVSAEPWYNEPDDHGFGPCAARRCR